MLSRVPESPPGCSSEHRSRKYSTPAGHHLVVLSATTHTHAHMSYSFVLCVFMNMFWGIQTKREAKLDSCEMKIFELSNDSYDNMLQKPVDVDIHTDVMLWFCRHPEIKLKKELAWRKPSEEVWLPGRSWKYVSAQRSSNRSELHPGNTHEFRLLKTSERKVQPVRALRAVTPPVNPVRTQWDQNPGSLSTGRLSADRWAFGRVVKVRHHL